MVRRVWLAICLAVLAALVFSGCGPAATPSVTPVPSPTEPSLATQLPEATEAPAEPKIFTYVFHTTFYDLDPAHSFTCEEVVLCNCYENLIYYNPPGSEERLRPGLATSWESSEDGTEWTFHLREGVTFQDGNPFNAEAVKSTIEYYLSWEGEGCTYFWDSVEEVEVVDDYTVKFHLSYPAPIDLISTATYCGHMVSPAVLDQPKEWFDEGHCVGTGPYTIESFEPGQRLVMTRFDDYWGEWEDGQFDKIVFEVVEDEVTRLQMITGSEGDFIWNVPADKVADLEAREDLVVHSEVAWKNTMLMLNTRKPPLDNRLVRQALAYSFPYDEFIQRSQGFYNQPRGLIPEGLWGNCDDCFQYTYDLEKARDLLEQAGYPEGGFKLVLNYTPALTLAGWAAELWYFPLAELGIELDAQAMTFDAMWEMAKSDPMTAQDIGTISWWASWPTPYDFLFSMYHCEEETYFNWSYWCNSDFDQMIDEANELSTTDREAAEQIFKDAQELAIEECPAIWFVEYPDIVAIGAEVEGYVQNPAYVGAVFVHELRTTR